MTLLIRNIQIVDESKNFIGDLYIEDGLIKDYGENLSYKASEELDGQGLTLMPGFIDLHAHFRDPGYTYKEDLESASKAALRGGYTTANLMANTKPIASNMEIVDYVLDKSEKLDLIDLHQTVSLTKDFDGKTLSHLDEINRDNVKFLSDDGVGVVSNKIVYDAMLKAKERDFTIMTHAEDMDLTPLDYRISENIISFRDLYLSKVTGAHLHLSHVSTKEVIRAIRLAKAEGTNVSCEVSPHHIALWDNDYRVNPPIREKHDVLEIIKGIKDGTVDAIATDHAPHTKEDKEKGAPGLSGIETSFSICYTELVEKGHIDLSKLSQLMSANPARIFGEKKGLIEKDYIADLVLVNLDKEYTIDSNDFLSRGKNTPFEGMNYYGQVVKTIKDGKIKFDGGILW